MIHSFWFVEFSEHMLEILPEFLALFPSHKHVRFAEPPEGNKQAMLVGGFIKVITLRCPHIKTVLINGLPLLSLWTEVIDNLVGHDMDCSASTDI